MSGENSRIRELLEQRDREFMLAKTSVKMRSSVENIGAGDYRIEQLSEGQSVELPRWMVEELARLNLAETSEEPFEAEIFRVLSREKMMGPLQLSVLPQDFYVKMKRRLSFLTEALSDGRAKKEELDRLRAGGYDLIGMRLSKLLSLSSSSTSASMLSDKLTPEEMAFFSISQSLSKEWRAALLGGAK